MSILRAAHNRGGKRMFTLLFDRRRRGEQFIFVYPFRSNN